MTTTVFVDSSFILYMMRNHRAFDEEIRMAVLGPIRISILDCVVMELQRLARGGNFNVATLAKIALEMIESRKISVMDSASGISDVDTAILASALAERNLAAVATVDRNLRHILLKNRLKAVFPTGHRKPSAFST